MASRTRQAILKAGYEDWFPWVKPGVWYRAAWLAELVLRQRQAMDPRWEAEERIPSDTHFDFRGGGRPRRSGSQRSRLADAPEVYQGLRIPRPSRPERPGCDADAGA